VVLPLLEALPPYGQGSIHADEHEKGPPAEDIKNILVGNVRSNPSL
jgi:hypothetical protein